MYMLTFKSAKRISGSVKKLSPQTVSKVERTATGCKRSCAGGTALITLQTNYLCPLCDFCVRVPLLLQIQS